MSSERLCQVRVKASCSGQVRSRYFALFTASADGQPDQGRALIGMSGRSQSLVRSPEPVVVWRDVKHGAPAEALSVREHLPEPEEGGLAVLAGHVVDRPAVAKAIPQLGELGKADVQHLLAAESCLEPRPERLGGEHVLELAEVAVFQLAGRVSRSGRCPCPDSGVVRWRCAR